MMFRHLVLWSVLIMGLGGLTACGQTNEQSNSVIDAPLPPSPYQIILVSTDFGVGQPRISFMLYDGLEPVANVDNVQITAVDIRDDESHTAVWQGDAIGYTDYELPYWVVYPEINESGYWGMIANITHQDGSRSETTFVIDVLGQSLSPAIGDPAPASQNRTLADTDISQLNSGTNSNPALYQMTVAEAIGSSKPSVVGFITPGLCQTEWCTPVLGSVESLWAEVGDDRANFIHIEVYEDFQELRVVAQMGEWQLNTEPWVFVLDENGRIAAKFSGPVSPRELDEALRPLLEG